MSGAAPDAAGPCTFKLVIPARFGSTRLPGKPLLKIAGKPMIQHVAERGRESAAEEVVVATDDQRVFDVCAGLGIDVEMTAASHRSGSDRIAEVVARRGWADDTLVVDLQGDEPAMPAALVDQVARDLAGHSAAVMATLAHPITDAATLFDPHVVKVVTDATGYALYFSRAPLPWHRDEFVGGRTGLPASIGFLRHIGLYAYRAGFIRRYVQWPPAPLEQAESLEQLRVLWHGERIHLSVTDLDPGHGVDTAQDLARVEMLLAGR